jgi:hypothetical protein
MADLAAPRRASFALASSPMLGLRFRLGSVSGSPFSVSWPDPWSDIHRNQSARPGGHHAGVRGCRSLNRRVRAQPAELAETNDTLESRVSDRLAEIERLARLKRSLPGHLELPDEAAAWLPLATGEAPGMSSRCRSTIAGGPSSC